MNDPFNTNQTSLDSSESFLKDLKKSIRKPSGSIMVITSNLNEEDVLNEEISKRNLLDEIYRLSVVLGPEIPHENLAELRNSYLDVMIHLLNKYPLNWNQLGYVTGNCLAGTSSSREAIKTNTDLINHLSQRTNLFSYSIMLGMRNFWYILHEQPSLSLSDLQYVRDRLEPFFRHFITEENKS